MSRAFDSSHSWNMPSGMIPNRSATLVLADSLGGDDIVHCVKEVNSPWQMGSRLVVCRHSSVLCASVGSIGNNDVISCVNAHGKKIVPLIFLLRTHAHNRLLKQRA